MNHKKFLEELMRALSKLNGVEFKNTGQQINVKLDDGRDFVIWRIGGKENANCHH